MPAEDCTLTLANLFRSLDWPCAEPERAAGLHFTLPWRGRVASRRDAGWGARRRRDSQRTARAFTPSRRPSGGDLPPPGEGEDKRCARDFLGPDEAPYLSLSTCITVAARA